jgi:hypothetical protein
MNWLLAMPTIRQPNLDFLDPVRDHVDVCIIDDTDGDVPASGWPSNFRVYRYADRERLMGRAVENRFVPRKSPSSKNFALWLAHKDGHDGIITLDDDVDLRVEPEYMDKIPVGREVAASVVDADDADGWVNATSFLTGGSHLVSRGVPYEYRAENHVAGRRTHARVVPAFNQGLWSGTPDINGIDKIRFDLAGMGSAVSDPHRSFRGYVLVGPAQKLPCSIMNCQLSRELVPAFYQPPDYKLDSGWVIRRHDDVWSCRFAKACADLKGHAFTFGEPIGLHTKEGDPRKEAVAEHVTNLIQPYFEGLLNGATAYVGRSAGVPYAEVAFEVATNMLEILKRDEHVPTQYHRVLADYATRCRDWANLFR